MSSATQGLNTQQFIDGLLVAGEGPEEQLLNPASGEVLLLLAEASAQQVSDAVESAQRAFPSWSRTIPARRAAVLLAIADVIERHATMFAELESLNCGKPYHQALSDDIPAAIDTFRYFAGAIRCQHGQLGGEYLEGHTSMIRRDAIGVVASIAPWNYPLMMAAWKMAPALAAGNTVVFKPS